VERRVEVVIDPLRQEKVSLRLPLEFRRRVEEVRAELGLPTSVDVRDPLVAKAVALAGAARDAQPPVRLAFFGGTAFRLLCPSSNDPTIGLRHDLHDIDMAVLVKEVRDVRRFLTSVEDSAGSALTFFETSGDRIFNSLSGGQRLRWHMAVATNAAGLVLGTLDIVADAFRFCHRIDVRSDVERSAERGWTLEPAHLLLTKGQFVQKMPRADAAAIPDRVLEPFGRRDVIVGPEAKDVQDMLSLLHDHEVGEGAGEISPSELRRLLAADWGLWKTFGLNLGLIGRSRILRTIPAPVWARIEPRLETIRDLVAGLAPKRRLGFLGGPWWQEVDTTASTDLVVPIG